MQKNRVLDRPMQLVPLVQANGRPLELPPRRRPVLIVRIIDECCPRFSPGGKLLYVGHASEQQAYFDRPAFAALGLSLDDHGKMPDVVVYDEVGNRLVLVQALSSKGVITEARRAELDRLFAGRRVGVVFVTAFPTRRAVAERVGEIPLGTEVWIADSPSHLIQFGGDRVLALRAS